MMQGLLEFVGIEPERFHVTWVSGSEGQRFADLISELTAKVRSLGPNRKLRDQA